MSEVLAGFTESTFTYDGLSRSVYAGGSGPAVIVIHEIPGLHPGVVDFGRRVVDAGFSVRMPSLFGTPGQAVSMGYTLRTLAGACVAREFSALALNRTSPVIGWLRQLAAEAHAECGGPGVGAVGMCFTGGFALGMMVDDTMLAPVLSQPSLPFPVTPSRRRAVGISDADLARVKARAADGACLMGLRFTEDMAVPEARFDTLRRELGDAFIAIEIDSSKGNAHGIPRAAHSVLSEHLVDEPGHPTRDALDRVLAFFAERLTPTP
jgi:dienelactone hydrolase